MAYAGIRRHTAPRVQGGLCRYAAFRCHSKPGQQRQYACVSGRRPIIQKDFKVNIPRLAVVALPVIVLALTSGCASVTGTTLQSVSIQTLEPGGKELPGAMCEMTNNKGKWFITTPGSTTITRSNDDMQVVCKKGNLEPGRASVVSVTKGAMFGNIILGGGIGAIIDHNSGAAYEYPAFFQVLMGAMTRIEAPKEGDPKPEPVASSSVPANAGNPQTLAPTPIASVDAKTSPDDRLKELKRLHEAGLIDTNVYLEQQRKTLDSAH